MPKPFIAARIPEVIDEKLKAHVASTGADRTTIIVSALAQYLGCSIETPVETKAIDRLEALEKRVEELERRVGQPVQKSLLEDIVISPAKVADPRDGSKTLLTNRELADLTGSNSNTVKGRHRQDQPIKFEEQTYVPVRVEGKPLWKPHRTTN